ncbi:FAD-binding domain-containing protein [Microbacterium sp. ABRD28]|uniref:FAD-binding domain-containing protein n=1 Tax=Microbacterium sp. ABRD28 TaxID=2268461 RepID=UPI000F55663C|nr:FAD-binding domain-containing protein [Microbacterium sp. ABRD28]AZC13204.1 DNA photolyase [Microbacterium sp. ABRD28]
MFDPTRAAGLEALRDFVPRAGSAYARQRNIDTGPHRTNVSTLSPYIRHRLVTEREVVTAVLEAHSLSAAEKFVQEVMWRTYWKGWLEQNPEVWRRYRQDVAELIDAGSADTPEYRDAVSGRTGIDAMDAWAGELVETGYLHNHTRMWFASIWIFTLRLPWQLGADFFYRHLLDGDAASNTLSWRWVAGLQTVGKTYLATASNIARYTEGRFHPEGLATSAPALSEEPLPPRSPIPSVETAVSGERLGILLHEEDLALDSLRGEHPWLDGGVVAIAASADAEARSPMGASDIVRAFTAGALADGLDRAAPAATALVLGVDPAAAVVEWAAAENLDTVVMPYAPVGPVEERMTALRAGLRDGGIALRAARRDWDSLAWPHARRGFFPFRTQIPQLLSQQGIPASPGR